MPSTLTKDCHLPLAPGTKHRQKGKSGNPPPSKPKGHKRKTHRFVFDEESAALNPSHQHFVWVPRHRISSVTLNRGKSRVRRGDSASSGGKNAMTHCRRIQYSRPSQRSRGLLVWVVWGVCCLEIFFFLKQNNYLVLGLLSKCHLRGQSPERSPCLKKRHRPGKQHLPVDTLQEPAVLPGHQGWATPRSLLRQWYNPNCIISVVFVHQPVVIWYCKSVSTNMESRNF